MNNPLPNYVLVTGDVVIDCHLYGGLETATALSGGSGTVYAEHLGGAALTCKLLQASSDEKGLEAGCRFTNSAKPLLSARLPTGSSTHRSGQR